MFQESQKFASFHFRFFREDVGNSPRTFDLSSSYMYLYTIVNENGSIAEADAYAKAEADAEAEEEPGAEKWKDARMLG